METNYTSEMTMLITVSSSIQPAPSHHLSPPPTLPKPGKDNLRLQRLLKKAAKKNAILAAEQGKSFRSSLSPVNEASSDLEHNESAPPTETPETTASTPANLLSRLSIKPVTLRMPSPIRRSKPFTLKVTEQRSIAEHLMLTTSTATPLLHKPGPPDTSQQPEGVDTTHPPSPHNPSVSVFPQLLPSGTASQEKTPEVTYVTKMHTYFHTVKPPRAKTPPSNETQATISHTDKRLPSLTDETSCSEPSPGQTPSAPDDSKATAPTLEPPLLSATEAEPPNQEHKPVPTEESNRALSPKPSTSNSHADKPTTHGSDTEIPGSESTPELAKQDSDTLSPPTSSTPWRQTHPEKATPAQADSSGATTTDTKAEHVTQPQLTSSLPNTSSPLKTEPAVSSVEARPPGPSGGGWHRLRKHLMVQPDAPNFPEPPEPEKLGQEEGSKKDSSQAIISQDNRLFKSRATRMWDAILYQLTVNKEKKQEAEEKKVRKEESFFLPRRLPILLHKPRFDARKLKELASKPMTKFTTVFEVSRFRPKVAEEHTKSFNRTASGWPAS